MPSSNTPTWKQTPPKRPSINDVGGGQKANGTPAPDPVRHLTAEDVNQTAQQLVALGATVPVALVCIAFSGGAPYVASVVCVRDDVSSSDFTLTDLAAGDTKIAYDTTKFPPPAAKPAADVNGPTPALVACDWYAGSPGQVRVRTHDAAAAGVDVAFTLRLY